MQVKWQLGQLLLLLSVLTVALAKKDESNVAISGHESSVKSPSLTIQTPIVSYDRPSLTDYEKCEENRDTCLKVCESHSEQKQCTAACPLCPILVHHGDPVVQGVNDTDYHGPPERPLNTTNIVHLTNEIRNVIDTQLGDVSIRNENNVQVHQNVSRSGGKFGLGYKNQHSCCYVVYTGKDNQRKRQRFCGEHCKARVMLAKSTIQCRDDKDQSTCQPSVKYVAHRPHRRTSPADATHPIASRCRSISSWPFISCPQKSTQHHDCQRCLQLPYGYILQHGIPSHCKYCFHAAPVAEPRVPYVPQSTYMPQSAYVPQSTCMPQSAYVPTFVPSTRWPLQTLDYDDNYRAEPEYYEPWKLESTEDTYAPPKPSLEPSNPSSKEETVSLEDEDTTFEDDYGDYVEDENDSYDVENHDNENKNPKFKRSLYSRHHYNRKQ